MTKRSYVGLCLLGSALVAMPILARAQTDHPNIGKQEYESHCAVCHGPHAKGNGPLASILKKKVPDLTLLKRHNKGIFPVQRVYDIIDGTKPIAGHGTRDMPAWGVQFMKQAPPYGGPYTQYEFVNAKILALIGYLDSIQAK